MEKKFKLTVQVEDNKPWAFNGVTTYTDKRLVITQIFKKVLKTLYKRDNDTSFREFKELDPIKNKIKRIEEAMNNKKKVKIQPSLTSFSESTFFDYSENVLHYISTHRPKKTPY